MSNRRIVVSALLTFLVQEAVLSLSAGLILSSASFAGENEREALQVHLSWGHISPASTAFSVRLTGENVEIASPVGENLEGEESAGLVSTTQAGGGDADGVECTLVFKPMQITPIENLNSIWADLIKLSDPDTARRLLQDPSYRPDLRKITVRLNPEGTRGFSLTVDQLQQNEVFRIPDLDVYVTTGENPPSFEEYQHVLSLRKGKRVLDRVSHDEEARLEEYTSRWEDMGSPTYKHSNQPEPGHIVGLTWDSAVAKFGIDRGAGVRNDYGNPDHFRLWFDFGDLAQGLSDRWRGQALEDGYPIITTTFEKDGIRFEVEQLAYPLYGPPVERCGDIPMVLLSRVRATNLLPETRNSSWKIHHQRQLIVDQPMAIQSYRDGHFIIEADAERWLYLVQGLETETAFRVGTKRTTVGNNPPEIWSNPVQELSFTLQNGESREWIVKLPSPMAVPSDRESLLGLRYETAREKTLAFWSDCLKRGAQFDVPEKAVNDLYRANLWHALRLPRRHGCEEEGVQVDLPYSNFAYDQNGTPWPVNQAVYVDYMLYDLRGYFDLAEEELRVMYRNNQEENGHIKGYANWGVYTPSMLYTVAKHYLLSQDRDSLERLLPQTLTAMDWCLEEIRRAEKNPEKTKGLIVTPLNDLTGEGIWAFTQAYFYAGLDLFGRVLEEIGHPRAAECREAARTFRQSVENAFAEAAVRSPLVQLRDHTWIPYVPCEALTPRRMFDQWYPTDVDTGAVHLLRLQALPVDGTLAESLLNDHEDNLFLYGWGMANEPVYNQQATAYLLRDEPEAVIRAFYSYMACAFSHSALEPVEHRWTWGQYFGPPSTDGAWFELYRNMLIRERDDDTLLLLQATPRTWLEGGKQIQVKGAPTYYGPISFQIDSQSNSKSITAKIEMPKNRHPKTFLLRLRHPEKKPIRSVTVNGQDWKNFDTRKEWVVIEKPADEHYLIQAKY